MIFGEPTPFKEALDYELVKRLMPTAANSRELSEFVPAEIRARARFSSAVTNMDVLGRIDSMIKRAVAPSTVIDPATGAQRPARPGEYMDRATFRLELGKTLRATGYVPPEGAGGTLRDLGSESRQNVIFDTNVRMAAEYGGYAQGQNEAVLDLYPCQELYREESREKPRDWQSRWEDAGGEIYDGRMIARKDDGIWTAISAFGLPYPPFDFGSGMGVRDVRRDEAESLGVIEPEDTITPEFHGLNDEVYARFDKETPASLLEELQNAFGSELFRAGNKLVLQPQPEVEIARVLAAREWNPAGHTSRVWARVTDQEAERVAKDAKVDVAGYRHAFDSHHAGHIQNEHPDVTPNDFKKIPDIVLHADRINKGTAATANPRVEYIKKI